MYTDSAWRNEESSKRFVVSVNWGHFAVNSESLLVSLIWVTTLQWIVHEQVKERSRVAALGPPMAQTDSIAVFSRKNVLMHFPALKLRRESTLTPRCVVFFTSKQESYA